MTMTIVPVRGASVRPVALVRLPYYGERTMSDARLLVLVSLSDGAKHGYSIQHDIETFTLVFASEPAPCTERSPASNGIG